METRLILFAHGSHDPLWRAPFEELLRHVGRGGGEVDLAYLEFCRPTLADTARRAVAAGVRQIRLLPLFLSAGGHVSRDIPGLVAQVEREHPELAVEVLPPIGQHPRFQQLIREIALACLDAGAREMKS